ncbi:MAG: hypothetical protein FD143_3351 [Ignavibacteria bacterium]|nr:MAG: hypothetical protein FD143_3351 [Ignavibacteria bacterium]KAF0151754.1 MAG: hypothetical protein FD188_3441 [Ignavibacteria bacterium]
MKEFSFNFINDLTMYQQTKKEIQTIINFAPDRVQFRKDSALSLAHPTFNSIYVDKEPVKHLVFCDQCLCLLTQRRDKGASNLTKHEISKHKLNKECVKRIEKFGFESITSKKNKRKHEDKHHIKGSMLKRLDQNHKKKTMSSSRPDKCGQELKRSSNEKVEETIPTLVKENKKSD